MKKRLLSAALALAMVLTMLPLSALPAFAATPTGTNINSLGGVEGIAVRWYNQGDPLPRLPGATTDTTASAGAYYYAGVLKNIDGNAFNNGNAAYYYVLNSGVLTPGNTWYSTVENAIGSGKIQDTTQCVVNKGNASSIKLLSNVGPLSLHKNLTIDVNGNTIGAITIPAKTPSGTSMVNNPCTQLTIEDSTKKNTRDMTDIGSGNITVAGSGTVKENGITITLNNVATTGTIAADYTTSCTVNVYGSKTGAIKLTGTSGGAINLGNGNTRGGATTVSLTTTGTAQGGTITATDAIVSGITLSGVGAKLTGTNLTSSGGITLLGLTAVAKEDEKSTLNTPTVTLYNSRITGAITQSSSEVLTKNYSVTLNNNTQVTGGISLNNANVTVNNSAAGAITVKNGDVKLNGSATGPASAGEIELGGDKKAASLTVTGTNVSTGAITKKGGTVNVTVPESDTNSFDSLDSGIDNRGISGGVWGAKVPADNLNLNLRYQALNKGGKYRYYSDSQFQNVLDAYQVGKDTALSPASGTRITLVKDSNGGSATKTITFKNGNDILAVVYYGTASLPLVLPSSVNGRTVLKWSEYNGSGNLLSEPAPGTTYSTPIDISDRVLNAQATDNAITKLMNVVSNMDGVTARLNGNVITLSGTVLASDTTIKVTIETDGNPKVKQEISIIYDNGKVTFANQNGTLPPAIRVSNDSTTLIIGNGSASYTLNGSGLRVLANGLKNRVHGYTETALPVIVTVNCSGTGWTTVRKAELAGLMSNDATAFGSTLTLGKTGSQVSFKDSPAVKEALNAAVAGITQSQIDSWILNAQNTAWRKNHTTTPTAADRTDTGYSEVHVVAYMAVNITNYNTANKPGTMTMTLTPSYYVEVTGTGGAKITSTYKLDPNKSTELNALRPVNNRSLGSLTGEMGTIALTLEMESAFDRTAPVAHQGATYAYPENFIKIKASSNSMTFNITHAINGALGQFIVDGQKPMVTRYDTKDGNEQGYYDTLQAAVDDAENGQYIEVDANYKGSCNITVTGEARKFTINTNGANKVTSNVSGVVTELPGGNEYQVQLERDNIVTGTTISVGGATGGSMTANVTSTRPGQTVTLTANPSAGYQAGTPTVRTNTGAAVSVSALGNNTFSFVVPAGATSISVTPSFVLNTGLPFTDVPANAWYFDGVKYCYNTMKGGNRLMQGLSTTTFGPNNQYERAQVVQILWNMKGRPEPKTTINPFYDVRTDLYAYKAILWAVENGYAEGYPGGTFRPNQAVTREEMIVFLWRAAGKPAGYSSLSLNGYNDGYNVHDWAQNAMKWALAYGILSGQNSVSLGGTIAPRAVAYRSQVAVTVMNFDKLKMF